jgi:hypothetical protein
MGSGMQHLQQPCDNLPACHRDLLFNILKEASAHLGARAGSAAAVAPQAATPTAVAAAEALSALQQRSRELLQRLMPCNLPFLAELLVGWLLQAALTGESVMAAEVAALAQRDLGRFQRLNQRLQVGAVAGGLLWQWQHIAMVSAACACCTRWHGVP